MTKFELEFAKKVPLYNSRILSYIWNWVTIGPMTVISLKLSQKLISLLPPPSCSLSFCVHLLVGADSLSDDLIRETLFHYAKEDNIFVVQLLFKLKISPNLIDSNGTTAFHHNVSTIQMLKLFHQGMKFYFRL